MSHTTKNSLNFSIVYKQPELEKLELQEIIKFEEEMYGFLADHTEFEFLAENIHII